MSLREFYALVAGHNKYHGTHDRTTDEPEARRLTKQDILQNRQTWGLG